MNHVDRPALRCRQCDREFRDSSGMLKVEAGACSRGNFVGVEDFPLFFCNRRCLADYHTPGRRQNHAAPEGERTERRRSGVTAQKRVSRFQLRLR